MNILIKNLSKTLLFLGVLFIVFWIPRLILILSNDGLAIQQWNSYLITSLRFDLKAMVIWFSPLFISLGINQLIGSPKLKNFNYFLFTILYLLALLFNLIAVFYYPNSKSIVGVELFDLIAGQDFGIISTYIIDFMPWIVLLLLVVWGALWVHRKTSLVFGSIKAKIFFLLVVLILLGFFARGSLKLKPLNLLDAYAYLEPKEAVSAVTPLYVLIESVGKPGLTEVDYVSQERLNQLLVKDSKELNSPISVKPNLCLVLLESFGKEYTGQNKAGRPSYTPFLDSLVNHSIYFDNAYANGLKSMDAVASILSGIPSFMTSPYIGSVYGQNNVKSVPEELKLQGYQSSFFHAADELSMGFKPYLLAEGLDEYIAKQQYPDIKDFDGTWGIFDMPFLEHVANKISQYKEPWFAGVFTLSSHHPYTVPDEYGYLSEGSLPIHKSVRYTDKSLQSFFEKVEKLDWFDSTIFIITADHSSINETETYWNYRGKYEVPLLIYAPAYFKQSTINKPVQHTDVYTTLLELGGVDSLMSLGYSLFDSTNYSVANFDGNIYTITSDSLCLEWNGIGNSKVFNYRKDPNHQVDLYERQLPAADSLMIDLKGFIQKFNYRMINNDFN